MTELKGQCGGVGTDMREFSVVVLTSMISRPTRGPLFAKDEAGWYSSDGYGHLYKAVT